MKHRLKGEGSAVLLSPLSNTYYATYGPNDEPGQAQCACGELSPSLPHRKARQAWFENHTSLLPKSEPKKQTRPKVKPCGWPEKQAHDSRADALEHIHALRKVKGEIRLQAYRCPAGHWHVGHYRPRKP